MRSLRIALPLLLALPATAQAGTASLRARDLSVGRAGSVAAAPRFDLVGLHWQGRGSVRFRTRDVGGRWSAWQTAEAEAEDLPDRGTDEARRVAGWRFGSPYWTGASDAIEYRLTGGVRRLRGYFVTSLPVPRRVLSPATTASPSILPRTSWTAGAAIRHGHVRYADGVHLAVVHHTAGSNSYSPAQSAAIVRAIALYHVRGNGWNDIAYNFLVDKYGQVFEGRYGGIERPVVGAHAQGFNSGSVGIALIGNYNGASVTSAARSALVRLLAWRLDVAHVDPLSIARRRSSGNPRYAAGTFVRLPAISGHRDTGPTACPGSALYVQLPGIARSVAATGLPKIYEPSVRGELGSRMRFGARLSEPLAWTVTVTDALKRPVASGSGFGSAVDWTWDARSVRRGRYGWTISAGPDARAATGSLGGPVAQVTVTDLRLQSELVTPNADRRDDALRGSYRLGAAAGVTATVTDLDGSPLATIFMRDEPAGSRAFVWRRVGLLPDGRYRLLLEARSSGGSEAAASTEFIVDRTLADFAVSAPAFSPNGDGRLDSVALVFRLLAPAAVTVRILRGERTLGTLLTGGLPVGPQTVTWDGRVGGTRLRDGSYTAVVTSIDPVATVEQRAPVGIDTRPPRLLLRSSRLLLFWVSEPATVTLDLDGERVVVERRRRGPFRVGRSGPVEQLEALAVDPAGNASKRIRRP